MAKVGEHKEKSGKRSAVSGKPRAVSGQRQASPAPPWEQPVPFERFMEYCLYDPERGYYRSGRKRIGREGDYFTSPHTHPDFARVLARFVESADTALGAPERFDLIELGAGEQRLGRELCGWIEELCPDLFRRLHYRPIDIDFGRLPRRIEGVILANEFFDALPVHRLRVRDSRLREVFVRQEGEEFVEEERDLSDSRIEDFMSRGFGKLREGTDYEANLRMMATLLDLSERIRRGVLITLDYGYDRAEYESVPRPRGTLLCYHRHQVNEEFYRRIGRQDITAHVNFEVMISLGRDLGWENQPLITQRQFLMNHGLGEFLLEKENRGDLDSPETLEERLRLKALLLPGGISDHLKVLIQTAGLPCPLGGGVDQE